jgi:hypothetical protein
MGLIDSEDVADDYLLQDIQKLAYLNVLEPLACVMFNDLGLVPLFHVV